MTPIPPNSDSFTAVATEISDAVMAGKKWYTSKTVWANIVATAALVIQWRYGFIMDPAAQAIAMTFVNLGLRKVTNEPIVW